MNWVKHSVTTSPSPEVELDSVVYLGGNTCCCRSPPGKQGSLRGQSMPFLCPLTCAPGTGYLWLDEAALGNPQKSLHVPRHTIFKHVNPGLGPSPTPCPTVKNLCSQGDALKIFSPKSDPIDRHVLPVPLLSRG